jgi:prepilin-type N-terminal cleavage/methylation domain-containing protein
MITMNCHRRVRPKGMTLTELLVVVVILLLLLVAVAPNLRPTDDQKGREAAATLSGMISRVKSRAAANSETTACAGIWLQPLETRSSVTTPSAGRIRTPPSRGTIDLFASDQQYPYIGDDSVSARVHVNVNQRPLPSLPKIDPALQETDAVVTFSTRYCPLIRNFCSDASVISISPTGAGYQKFYFRLLNADEQSQLATSHPGFFPRPYRDCNYGINPGDLDYQDRSRNPDPLGGQQNKYYDNSDADRIDFSKSNIIVGLIRRILVTDGNPFEFNPIFSPGRRAVSDPDPAPPDNSVTPVDPQWFPGLDSGGHFSIARPNSRAATPPLSLPAGYCVDIAWSMCNGTCLFNNSLATINAVPMPKPGITITEIDNFLSNEPIQLMFDKDGNMTSVVYRIMSTGFGMPGSIGSVIEQTSTLIGDVYLLVGRADRAGQPFDANAPAAKDDSIGANWQYPDSRWVKISRSGGTVLIADPKYGALNVYDSQEYARMGISAVKN